jgi:hypothetical protein
MRPILRAMRDELAQSGVPLTVVLMPIREYDSREWALRIYDVARELDLRVYDAWDHMQSEDRRLASPDFYVTRFGPGCPHFGEVGHRVYADWVDPLIGRPQPATTVSGPSTVP